MKWLETLIHCWKRCFRAEEGVYYIGGNDVLPPPLSPEEEKLWLDRLKPENPMAEQARKTQIGRAHV